MRQSDFRRASRAAVLLGLCALMAGPAWGFEPKQTSGYLDGMEFFEPELYISSSNVALADVLPELPNRGAWEQYLAQNAADGSLTVYIDPRSGTATNIVGAFPLIPGRGVGNRVTLDSVSRSLGRNVSAVDASVVADLAGRFVQAHAGILGIDAGQLGPVKAAQVTEELWQFTIPQEVNGVRVRDARVAGTINNGNLILLGTEVWGNASVRARAKLSAAEALDAGFGYVQGRSVADRVVAEPQLEIVPVAPQEYLDGEAFSGPVGSGYRHRLVWSFKFQRPPDHATWEMLVDAASGEVLALQDKNQYVNRQIKGGIYPLTSTEICPNPEQCGIMQPDQPMPFANTGQPAPNDFANAAGIFNHTGGTVTTTLDGKFVRMSDACGAINESTGTPPLDLGGTNGQHDCTSGGASPGNTPASRSGFYELNKLVEQAKGYLPLNTWLQAKLTSNMNIASTCNAFYSPGAGTINFYRSGGGCRNTGELAAVFDHEWGHAMDDNDTGGALSNSSEAYADIVGIYRLQASCVGHGFFWTAGGACGQTVDGTGNNADEDQTAGLHCNLDCSGVRDADWDKHADHIPDTPLNFVCSKCNSSTGPCGRQVHCAAAPVRQAAWDLVKRDLQAPPFSLDDQTSFIIGNKLFYQGSGNIGLWHACTCTTSSDGCGALHGYMQWLGADDDNGNLADGTPHMTAVHAAYDRHGIACATPTPTNSGCAGAPTTATTLSVTPGVFQNVLTWSAVPGATRYWVFRTEGYAGCNFGKALIAETTLLNYTDTEVANGRTYYYNVVAAGASSACFGPVSNCASGTPIAGPDFAVSCSPSSLTVWEGESGATECTVTSTDGFTGSVSLSCVGTPAGIGCGFAPPVVSPPANGSINSTLTLSVAADVPLGVHTFQVQGDSGAAQRLSSVNVRVVGYGAYRRARFVPGTGAPECPNPVPACDTMGLVNGRDTIPGGNEPNQPNTIDACVDGTSGTYHVAPSLDRLRLFTLDGTTLAPGRTVRAEAFVWVSDFNQDALDLYIAADAAAPSWTFLATVTPTANGLQTLSHDFTLPFGTRSALRGRFRNGGSAMACSPLAVGGSVDDHDDLVFALGPAEITATYDAVLKAPKCATIARSCDSGPTLLLGRGTMSGGNEPNQPNTINTSCTDGNSGTFHNDESNDRIKVYTNDGGPFAPGKTVTIEATVWAWSTGGSDRLELYYAADATAPVWTAIGAEQTPPSGGQHVLTRTYVLPAGNLQAVRARFRFSGTAAPTGCGTGSYNDHDDLIFAVQ